MDDRQPTHGDRGASAALEALLVDNPDALCAAMADGGRLVPMPGSVRLHGQYVFPGPTAMDAFVSDDKVAVIDAWNRAQHEPVVSIPIRVAADPDQASILHFFDLRDGLGVHVIVLETPDPTLVLSEKLTHDGSPTLVAHVSRDASSVFLDADDATTALLGWSRAELVGRPTLDLLHPEDAERAIEGWLAMRAAGSTETRSQIRLQHADGHYVWLEIVNDNHLDDPEIDCVWSQMVDITERMADLKALHERERVLHRLAEALPIGVCHLNRDGQVVHTNLPLVALLGPIDGVQALIRSVAAADRPMVEIAIERALQGRAMDIEVGVLHGFEERRCELTFRTMADDESGGIDGLVVCASDVTDRSRLRSELEHRASHDALSGCLNRAATVTALERALRDHPHVVVAYIDLDQFKSVNDTLGHAAGDELLRVAAARLRNVIRANDRLGRIGGDEFVVICPQSGTPFEVAELVDRLRDAICGDVAFAKQRIPMRASVGAACSIDGEVDAEPLLSRADAAMYAAKNGAHAVDGVLRAVPPVSY